MINDSNIPYWCEFSGNDEWRYVLKEQMTFDLFPQYVNISIQTTEGKELAKLHKDGKLVIYPGYCWDGATCAPDFPEVLRATLIHDIMCQLNNQPDWPYMRDDADYEFRRVSREDKFKFRLIYFVAVLLFGMIKEYLFPNKKYPGIQTKLEP